MNQTARILVASFMILSACVSARAAEPVMAPFEIDWRSDVESPVDVSFLLEAPAGGKGFVRVADGHLARGDGSRLRIWGVNVSGAAATPSKESAVRVARRLARLGVNGVRFHFFDRPAPRGIIDAKRDDTQHFDSDQLDRLDFFIAELKKQGIYTNLNLNVARSYKAGDGVADHEFLGFAKALTYFDPRLIELQKQYARALLTHRNPYTGNEYRHEPAVAIVELVNENSLVEAWVRDRLLGKNKRKYPGTWTDITAHYERALTEKYNQWLKDRLSEEGLASLRQSAGVGPGEPVPRLRREQFADAAPKRFSTEATFYIQTERGYFDEMARLLRDELGVKSPLVGSADHGHGWSGYPHLVSTSSLDVVDGHVYWQHPSYQRDPDTGRTTGFWIKNSPMVDDPFFSSVVQLSRSAVAGKPYTVSEVNHPFPNEYACEGIPILAAYGALHDWDGIFWYTLAHRDPADYDSRTQGHFDLLTDPVKMSQLAAGALLFLRADVATARNTFGRSYTREQVIESIRMSWPQRPYFTPDFPLAIPLAHATRITSFDGPATASLEGPATEPIRCDTGQLTWYHGEKQPGLVTIDAPRSQAMVGHCGERARPLDHLAAEVDVPFCAITVGAIDDEPIATASKLLLTTTARAANSEMKWDAKRNTLTDWGRAPNCIEPVTGTIVLKNLTGAKAVTAQPLDGAGRPLGPAIAAQRTDQGWSLAVGDPATTWYVVTVAR